MNCNKDNEFIVTGRCEYPGHERLTDVKRAGGPTGMERAISEDTVRESPDFRSGQGLQQGTQQTVMLSARSN